METTDEFIWLRVGTATAACMRKGKRFCILARSTEINGGVDGVIFRVFQEGEKERPIMEKGGNTFAPSRKKKMIKNYSPWERPLQRGGEKEASAKWGEETYQQSSGR